MVDKVALGASMRANLLSLQKTNSLLDTSQLRLSTGRKVNSALDDPRAFFTAQGLTNRASDLGRLLDGMGQSIQTVKAADDGVTAITKLMEQADSVVTQAKEHLNSGGSTTGLTAFEKDFDALMVQMNAIITDASYRGINLLGTDKLVTQFNEHSGTSGNTMEISGLSFTSNLGGITWGTTADEWTGADLTSLESRASEIATSLNKLRDFGASLANGLSIIQTREDFTKSLISRLEEGADKLTLADPNEEGAKLLALQTRMQLGVNALSLAAQSQQSVLQMF